MDRQRYFQAVLDGATTSEQFVVNVLRCTQDSDVTVFRVGVVRRSTFAARADPAIVIPLSQLERWRSGFECSDTKRESRWPGRPGPAGPAAASLVSPPPPQRLVGTTPLWSSTDADACVLFLHGHAVCMCVRMFAPNFLQLEVGACIQRFAQQVE